MTSFRVRFQSAVGQPSDVCEGGRAAPSAFPGEAGAGRQPHPHSRQRRLRQPAQAKGAVSTAAAVAHGDTAMTNVMAWTLNSEQ